MSSLPTWNNIYIEQIREIFGEEEQNDTPLKKKKAKQVGENKTLFQHMKIVKVALEPLMQVTTKRMTDISSSA